MKRPKHEENWEAADDCRDDDVPRMRGYFKDLCGRDTTLSDDDIVNIIAASDDDKDPDDWVKDMLAEELLPDLPA